MSKVFSVSVIIYRHYMDYQIVWLKGRPLVAFPWLPILSFEEAIINGKTDLPIKYLYCCIYH